MDNATDTGKAAHTCGGPVFGRKVAGCPRCDQLLAGAAPVRWAGNARADQDAARRRAIRAHRCEVAGCGPVCTAFDW
ncbi:MAG: hypothetical protein M0Q49_05605 [Porticoccaceae bacterium]|nr:hypothetical protein [Porticoccaceae bacterium]